MPDKQGRRYAWAAVVIIAAGGIGAGVGHWVRVEPATNAVETTALKEMTLAHPTQLDLEKATAVSPHAPKQLESTVQAARTSRTPSPSVSVAPGPNVSVELVAPQNSARALELNANADRPLKPTRSSPAAAETKQGSRTRQAVGQSSGEVGMPVRDPFLRRH